MAIQTDSSDTIENQTEQSLLSSDASSSDALAAFRDSLESETPADENTEETQSSRLDSEKANEQKPKEDEKEEKTATEEKKVEAEKPAKKSLTDELLGDDKPEEKAKETPVEEDDFDKVKLRSDASPKTRETFEDLKRKSRERVSAAEAKATQYQQEIEKLKTSTGISEPTKKELEELRAFRATFDVERDPVFVEKFVAPREKIFSDASVMLKGLGLKDQELEAFSKLPDEDKINQIAEWSDKLPSSYRVQQLKLNAQLAKLIDLDDAKRQHLDEVKVRAESILSERTAAPEKQKEEFFGALEKETSNITSRAKWLLDQPIPASATAEEKKRIESHNTRAAELRETYLSAAVDESPKGRAEAAFGAAAARYYKSELASREAELTAAKAELDKIKRAGSVGAKGAISNALPDGKQSRAVNLNTSTDDALEAFRATLSQS
jgi:hypothetical protein